MTAIPEHLRTTASGLEGASSWLADLPRVCRRLREEWSLQLGAPYDDGHVSLTVPATRGPAQVVLKVPMPAVVDIGTLAAGARTAEPAALRTWGGLGAVRLIEYDQATGAMLLERCLPGGYLHRLPDRDADEVAAALLERLHAARPEPAAFERLSTRATRLAGVLPQRYEAAREPFDRWLLDTAVDLLTRLAEPVPDEVLLHGDLHHENVLSSQRERWLAIDPLPMVGDPGYDAVQYLLFRQGDLPDPGAEWGPVIDRFCARLDLDPERVKAWTFARLVSDALASCRSGIAPTDLDAPRGDLWTARVMHRLRA